MTAPIFQGHSQVGQDRFAWEASGRKSDGWFVDIGCGDAISCNNSYALERLGWRGLCLDRYDDPERRRIRSAKMVVADGTTVNWREILKGFPPLIDYLSLDCDENSFAVLSALPLDDYGFGVITAEHDLYRLGPEQQIRQRELLIGRGYLLVCGNVKWEGHPFEDWYVARNSIYATFAERFRCDGKLGLEIVSGC